MNDPNVRIIESNEAPTLSVAAFIAEGLVVFVETFPQTVSPLTEKDQKLIENYRGWLRDERAQPK